MFEELTGAERKELARRYTENAEFWLRKLIDYQLSRSIGGEYISLGNFKKSLVNEVTRKRIENSTKLPRPIDATTFDQAIDILCHPNYWETQFKDALRTVYRFGREEARFFLSKLKDIRNDVSHGRNCSTRQLEQAICYSNDLADAIKAFFKNANMQRTYNVPMIVRYVDNLGNESNLDGVPEDISGRIIDWRRAGKSDLYVGDSLFAEVNVDPSYDEDAYDIYWFVLMSGYLRQTGRTAHVQIGNEHVGQQVELRFEVISKKDWHRQHGLDDCLHLIFRVLPPV